MCFNVNLKDKILNISTFVLINLPLAFFYGCQIQLLGYCIAFDIQQMKLYLSYKVLSISFFSISQVVFKTQKKFFWKELNSPKILSVSLSKKLGMNF